MRDGVINKIIKRNEIISSPKSMDEFTEYLDVRQEADS